MGGRGLKCNARVRIDLSLTGFDPKELDDLLLLPDDDDQADTAPPLPVNPVSRPGDLWLCGQRRHPHRVLCADATNPEAVRGCWVSGVPRRVTKESAHPR